MVERMRTEVVVQFTGGKDSTYLALLMARKFERVHLLTFHHSLIKDVEKVSTNAHKLARLFGTGKFESETVNVENLLKTIYQGDFFKDLVRYGSYGPNNFCGACRLAMVSHTILYCLKNGITCVCDGSNVSGFDLSQQEWSVPVIKKFYSDFGLSYDVPLYENRRNDIELLKSGLDADDPTIFFRSQPRCEGGGHFHNIYLRCYFLPLYGKEALKKIGTRWMMDRLFVCREYIRSRAGSPSEADSQE